MILHPHRLDGNHCDLFLGVVIYNMLDTIQFKKVHYDLL